MGDRSRRSRRRKSSSFRTSAGRSATGTLTRPKLMLPFQRAPPTALPTCALPFDDSELRLRMAAGPSLGNGEDGDARVRWARGVARCGRGGFPGLFTGHGTPSGEKDTGLKAAPGTGLDALGTRSGPALRPGRSAAGARERAVSTNARGPGRRDGLPGPV